MREINLTSKNFDKVIKEASGKVLVDFWAPWCGPCRMLAINLEEASQELEKQGVTVAKVNVDDNMELADRYKINSIPALMVFEGGELKKESLGYISVQDILNLVK